MIRLVIETPEAMAALGAQLAGGLPDDAGCVVYQRGELGAGKTTLARGVLRALGHAGRVKSPTYTLIESYPIARDGAGDGGGERQLHHLDLYRLASPEEVAGLALRDLDPLDWLLIEWPENGGDALPPADLVVYLEHAGSGRAVGLDPLSPVGQRLVKDAKYLA